MGKVDQINDAVNHGVTQRDKCVHTTQDQAVDDLLYQSIHIQILMLFVMILAREGQKLSLIS